jgi:hypothetical protein
MCLLSNWQFCKAFVYNEIEAEAEIEVQVENEYDRLLTLT